MTLPQPASKIADLDLEKFWDEKGWENIVFDSEDAAPSLSSYLHQLDSSYSGSSEMSPDNASSGTSFEPGSEISSDGGSIVEQDNETEEAGLAADCWVYRHPATPPASPEPQTPRAQFWLLRYQVQEIGPHFRAQSQKDISARLTALNGISKLDAKAILKTKVRQVVKELLRRVSELKQDKHRLRIRLRRLMRRLSGNISAHRCWEDRVRRKLDAFYDGYCFPNGRQVGDR